MNEKATTENPFFLCTTPHILSLINITIFYEIKLLIKLDNQTLNSDKTLIISAIVINFCNRYNCKLKLIIDLNPY